MVNLLPESVNGEWLGKVISEGLVVALGVAIGRSQLGDSSSSSENDDEEQGLTSETLNQLAFGVMGAMLIIAAIAPTEEILMLAAGIPPMIQLTLLVVSFLICWAVLAGIGFRGSQDVDLSAMVGGALGGAAVTFLSVGICVGFLLAINDSFEAPANVWIAQYAILSLPGSIGAAAARMLL